MNRFSKKQYTIIIVPSSWIDASLETIAAEISALVIKNNGLSNGTKIELIGAANALLYRSPSSKFTPFKNSRLIRKAGSAVVISWSIVN